MEDNEDKKEYKQLECVCTSDGFSLIKKPLRVYSEICGIAIAADKKNKLYLNLIPGEGKYKMFLYILNKGGKIMFKSMMGVSNTRDLEGMVVHLLRYAEDHFICGIAPYEEDVIGIGKKKNSCEPLDEIKDMIESEYEDIEEEDFERSDEDQDYWGFMGKVD